MNNIHIKFNGVDENAGMVFLQFATDENLHLIDQSTIHGFFPAQYNTFDIEELLPYMAELGQQTLSQQTAMANNKFDQSQADSFKQLIGQIKTASMSGFPAIHQPDQNDQYNPDSTANPNGNIDQMRNLILEVLAEEGLIQGAVK